MYLCPQECVQYSAVVMASTIAGSVPAIRAGRAGSVWLRRATVRTPPVVVTASVSLASVCVLLASKGRTAVKVRYKLAHYANTGLFYQGYLYLTDSVEQFINYLYTIHGCLYANANGCVIAWRKGINSQRYPHCLTHWCVVLLVLIWCNIQHR